MTKLHISEEYSYKSNLLLSKEKKNLKTMKKSKIKKKKKNVTSKDSKSKEQVTPKRMKTWKKNKNHFS